MLLDTDCSFLFPFWYLKGALFIIDLYFRNITIWTEDGNYILIRLQQKGHYSGWTWKHEILFSIHLDALYQ
jgi:hypothetical protein